MKTSDFLRKHGACIDGAHWAMSVSNDMADVWDALIEKGKYEWIVWTVTRPNVFPSSTLRKLACHFVRETPLHDGRAVWDLLTDGRSRSAVETAEAYADGKATKEELNSACSAAYAAYCAAGADHADVYATEAAYSAAYAARAAAYVARAARSAAYAARAADAADAVYSAYNAAYAAQIRMIAELGNPFREENDND